MTSLFDTLNPMAVKAQKLHVSSLTHDDFLVKSDAIFSPTFLGTAAEDMINIKHPFITDIAFSAYAPQIGNRVISRRAVAPIPRNTSKLFDSLRMIFFPLVYLAFLFLIVTRATHATMFHRRRSSTINTGFRFHVRNPITRVSKEI